MANATRTREILDNTVSRDEVSVVNNANKLKLGVFGPNLSGGIGGMTTIDGPLKAGSWPELKAVAQAADQAGLDALVPIVRWRGFRGQTDFWRRAFEPFTWASAVGAVTENIHIFTSCLVPAIHPIVAAKMGATCDHVSGGRWGLNVVVGWVKEEFKMFGGEMDNRERRYEYADEWMQVINRLWMEDDRFDFHGEFFDITQAESLPKPVQSPRPVVMNAGMSPTGQDFALRNADMLYIQLDHFDDEVNAKNVRDIKANVEERGGSTSVWTCVHVVCKDTEQEAEEFIQYYTENGDVEGAEEYAATLMNADSVAQEGLRADPNLVKGLVASSGIKPIVGTPDQVVEQFKVYSDMGLNGLAMAWVDYDQGIGQYAETLHPLMQKAGLRA